MFGKQRYRAEHISPLSPIDPWFDCNPLLPSDLAGGLWATNYGAADLYETEDTVIVQMTAPGFKAEDISVQEQQGLLTIRADRRSERRGERDGVQFEAHHTNFVQRSFRLPSEVDVGRAEATLQDGILTIKMPKAQMTRARRIPIQSAKQLATVQKPRRGWLARLTSWWHRPRARLTQKMA